jgi:raffinose/stachyose/melibiose transport system permease protein
MASVAAGSGRRKAGASRRLSHTALYVIAIVLAVLVIVPLVYVVLGGFRTTGQLAAKPVGIPSPWITTNYRELITSGTFWRQIGNSTLIAIIATVLVVAFGSLAAYALARFDFRGRESLYTLFTFGLLFPIGVAILPLYLLIRQLGLLDTPLGVALPEAAFGLPLTILILRPFMRNVPVELEDAAAIDGCGRLGFFWRILLPLSQPALATVSIVALVFSWNMFLLPLLVLNKTSEWTLPLGVTNYSTEYTQDTARILAYTALSMVPALAFFVAAERRIVGGLSGAVKG